MLVIRARPRSRCNNLPAVGTRCRSNVQQKYAWVHTLGFTMGATTLNLSTHLRPVVHPLIMSTYVVVVGATTILRNRFICKDQIEWRKDSGSRLIYIFLRSSLFQFSLSLFISRFIIRTCSSISAISQRIRKFSSLPDNGGTIYKRVEWNKVNTLVDRSPWW